MNNQALQNYIKKYNIDKSIKIYDYDVKKELQEVKQKSINKKI